MVAAATTTPSTPAEAPSSTTAAAGSDFAYCPDITPTPNVTQEPYYVPWEQISEDPELFRDEITWIDTGPGEGPGGNLIQVRAVDLTGAEGEREITGVFDETAVSAIRWALERDARVVSATPPHIRTEGYVSRTFLIVFPVDDDPFFVGQCAERDWEQNLRSVFGSDYAEQVTRLAAGPIRLPDAPQPEVTHLLPGGAPDELLADLNHVTLELDLPEQWAGAELDQSYVLVTRVEAGWNEALPLTWANPDVRSTLIGAYLPDRGDVELWILGNDGDPRDPVGRLASFEASEVLRLSASGTRDNAGVVRVTIDTNLSAAEVVSGNLSVAASLSGLT